MDWYKTNREMMGTKKAKKAKTTKKVGNFAVFALLVFFVSHGIPMRPATEPCAESGKDLY